MPTTKFKSPFATSFTTAISKGTPCSIVVNNIAKRRNTTPTVVFNSLFKAGLCFRQKFNGQWIYWATEGKKGPTTQWKPAQFNMWQSFVDWVIASGQATPEQVWKHCGSQQEFMTWTKKFFNRQFNTTTTSKTKKNNRTRTTTSRKRTATVNRKKTTTRNYKFSSTKGRTTKKYNRAA